MRTVSPDRPPEGRGTFSRRMVSEILSPHWKSVTSIKKSTRWAPKEVVPLLAIFFLPRAKMTSPCLSTPWLELPQYTSVTRTPLCS